LTKVTKTTAKLFAFTVSLLILSCGIEEDQIDNPTQGNLRIEGIVKVGQTVEAGLDIVDLDGLNSEKNVTYKWFANNALVQESFSKSFNLNESHLDQDLYVQTIVVDDLGNETTFESDVFEVKEKLKLSIFYQDLNDKSKVLIKSSHDGGISWLDSGAAYQLNLNDIKSPNSKNIIDLDVVTDYHDSLWLSYRYVYRAEKIDDFSAFRYFYSIVFKQSSDRGETWNTQHIPLNGAGFDYNSYNKFKFNVNKTGNWVATWKGFGRTYYDKPYPNLLVSSSHLMQNPKLENVDTFCIDTFQALIQQTHDSSLIVCGFSHGFRFRTISSEEYSVGYVEYDNPWLLNDFIMLENDLGFVFLHDSINNKGIMVKTEDAGKTWQEPRVLEADISNPILASNGDDIVIAWSELDQDNATMQYFTMYSRDQGNTWSDQVMVSSQLENEPIIRSAFDLIHDYNGGWLLTQWSLTSDSNELAVFRSVNLKDWEQVSTLEDLSTRPPSILIH
jgi:hypothetical protein